MTQTTCQLLVLLGCVACNPVEDHGQVFVRSQDSSDASVAPGGDANTDDARLYGEWLNTHAKLASGCTETTIFEAPAAFTIESSSGEVVTGTYRLDRAASASARPKLTLHLVRDNGLVDCLGNAKDESGLYSTEYLEFSNEDGTIDVYNKAQTAVLFRLEKQ